MNSLEYTYNHLSKEWGYCLEEPFLPAWWTGKKKAKFSYKPNQFTSALNEENLIKPQDGFVWLAEPIKTSLGHISDILQIKCLPQKLHCHIDTKIFRKISMKNETDRS